MGIRQSKGFKLLMRGDFVGFYLHFEKSFTKRIETFKKKMSLFLFPLNRVLLLKIYPKLVLGKEQYKHFLLLQQDLTSNYCDIISSYPIFFKNHFISHVAWMMSEEFERYYHNITPPPIINEFENTKYPPLINPHLIDYRVIDAKLAYYLNLPLPNNYKFVYMSTFGSGYQAMKRFFEYCKICVVEAWTPDPQIEYQIFYNNLLHNMDKYCMIYLSGFNIYGREKLFALIDAKVPLLVMARDPISILKPIVNHLGACIDKPHYTLKTNYIEFLDTIRYQLETLQPSLDILKEEDYNNIRSKAVLSITSRINALRHVSEIKYITFEEILEDKAFDTFVRLSKYYGFNPPNDRTIFEAKVNGGVLLGLLPRVLYVNDMDRDCMFIEHDVIDSSINDLESIHKKDSLKIIITTPQIQDKDTLIDISNILESKPFSNLYLLISADDYDTLQKNTPLFVATKEYLDGFVKELQRRANIENNKRLNENDILQKFRDDKELRLQYKEIFDSQLQHIKQNRPDIVANWKYYLQF